MDKENRVRWEECRSAIKNLRIRVFLRFHAVRRYLTATTQQLYKRTKMQMGQRLKSSELKCVKLRIKELGAHICLMTQTVRCYLIAGMQEVYGKSKTRMSRVKSPELKRVRFKLKEWGCFGLSAIQAIQQ